MHRQIVFTGKDFTQLGNHLLQGSKEQFAFALAGVNRGDGYVKILVKEVIQVPGNAFEHQSSTFLRLKKDFVAKVITRAVNEDLALLDMHSHPWSTSVAYSSVDDRFEVERFLWSAENFPQIEHATLLMGRGSIDARMWCKKEEVIVPIQNVRVADIPMVDYMTTSSLKLMQLRQKLTEQRCLQHREQYRPEVFHRQILAFGKEGQSKIATLKYGIAGVSGTGSWLIALLVALGARDIVAVDPDVMEVVNLNRMWGASYEDAEKSRPKVEVIRREVQRLRPEVNIHPIQNSVANPEVQKTLKGVDILWGCVDGPGARLILNRTATQYMIPYFDIGTGIFVEQGTIVNMGGQVRTVLPGGPCLECMGAINKERAATELMNQDQRAEMEQRGYVQGAEIPAPQVAWLNNILVSMALQEFMNLVGGFKPFHPYVLYDALRSQVIHIDAPRDRQCVCCGEHSPARLGDLERLFEAKELAAAIPSLLEGRSGDK
jgi:molybdopterin/thiamine biosynthesis adenylyltransferase